MQVGPNEAIKIDAYVDERTCAAWLSKVFSNSQELLTRFEFIQSYGSAWYLDIEHGLLPFYHANSQHTNELIDALPGLREKLCAVSEMLVSPSGQSGLPCRSRASNLGPYWVDAGVVLMMSGMEGVIHADFEGLAPYPAKLFDPDTRAYSAVICLAAAVSGGNLEIWQERKLANEDPPEYLKSRIIEYAPGTLSVFDSFCYHKIQASVLDDQHRYRAIAATHFLYLAEPYPHWEYWF